MKIGDFVNDIRIDEFSSFIQREYKDNNGIMFICPKCGGKHLQLSEFDYFNKPIFHCNCCNWNIYAHQLEMVGKI